MTELRYEISVRVEGGSTTFAGKRELRPGANHVVCDLPRGELISISASLPLKLQAGEKIFMNGFQTWTYCPEYNENSRIRGLSHLPKAGVRHYGLDRYGDNYFVDYPNKRGVTHGESWCYFRLGEQFRLFASLDERPGYTLFQYDSGSLTLSIRRDCAGLSCGGEFHALDLFWAEGGEDEVFDAWFSALGVKPRTREKIAGYSSWYNRYENISQQSILEDLEGCADVLKQGDLFQIDDGWEPAVGDWLEPDGKKFPDGMRAAAEAIHRKGLRAGLWLAPFVARKGSRLMKEHPDWLLLHEGEPWYCGCNWGGFYSLDIDNPEVLDYLKQVFDRVFKEWGFDLVKLDFLYGAAPFGNERETRGGRMIRAMELLRQLCGDKLILGCGVPMMPAFGLVDYCRVSCDVGLDWDGSLLMQQTHRERVSTRQAISNSIFRRQLNGRAWLSDPDVFFLREENLKLKPDQKAALATVCSLFGGVLLTSDNMGQYSEETRETYARMLENRTATELKVDADGKAGVKVTYRVGSKRRRFTIRL